MVDYSDYESWLDEALFKAMVVLRESDADLNTIEGRQQLYDALTRVADAGRAFREYWNDNADTKKQEPIADNGK